MEAQPFSDDQLVYSERKIGNWYLVMVIGATCREIDGFGLYCPSDRFHWGRSTAVKKMFGTCLSRGWRVGDVFTCSSRNPCLSSSLPPMVNNKNKLISSNFYFPYFFLFLMENIAVRLIDQINVTINEGSYFESP